MTFKYKLQKLLDIKQQLENGAKNELAIHTISLNKEQTKLSKIKEEGYIFSETIISQTCEGISVHKLCEYKNYFKVIKGNEYQQSKNVDTAADKVQHSRQNLIRASKDKKVLEKLKENKKDKHKQLLFKKEQKIIDELTSYHHTQKQK